MTKLPNICPKCEQAVALPNDKRFVSISCSSCSAHLWVITDNESHYLFDKNDEDLFRHVGGKFRARREAQFAANGWVAESKSKSNKQSSIFQQFVQSRKFCLQNEPIVELPVSAIELDFADVACSFPIQTKQQMSIESELRKITIEAFQAVDGLELCYAIDVNHSAYTFVASDVDYREPDGWPISFTPFSDYLLFSSRCFLHGVFVDPRNKHISVYGETLTAGFSDGFPDRVIQHVE